MTYTDIICFRIKPEQRELIVLALDNFPNDFKNDSEFFRAALEDLFVKLHLMESD